MSVKYRKTLSGLRNTRDLRAEILALAAMLTTNKFNGRLTVVAPVISVDTVQEEWDRLLPALAVDVRKRMTLAITSEIANVEGHPSLIHLRKGVVLLDRPNYRYEVLRLLIGASLEGDGPQPIQGLIEKIGVSQTPIRSALDALKRTGIARSPGRGVEIVAEDVSSELLAKIGALPQTLRFRFERGAQIKTPAMLLKRAQTLLQPGAPKDWHAMALSGVAVAQAEVPKLDLVGLPRLDLVVSLRRVEKTFDTALMRLLDDGLELEQNVLAPVHVVVTLVRSNVQFDRRVRLESARYAAKADVLLSLLDMGLRDQAIQYAKGVRP